MESYWNNPICPNHSGYPVHRAAGVDTAGHPASTAAYNMDPNGELMRRKLEEGVYFGFDTCIFMGAMPQDQTFFQPIIRELKRLRKKVWIPYEVVMELEFIMMNGKRYNKNGTPCTPEEIEASKRLAKHGLKRVRVMQGDGVLTIFEQAGNARAGERFADPVFLAKLDEYRVTKRIALLTNDRNLQRDALAKNKSRSVRGFEIEVYYVTYEGRMVRCREEAAGMSSQTAASVSRPFSVRSSSQANYAQTNVQRPMRPESPERVKAYSPICGETGFAVDGWMTKLGKTVLPMSEKVQTGSVLRGMNGAEYRLGQKITRGGEGEIYEVENKPKLLAKIMPMTERKREKVRLLAACAQKKDIGGAVLPCDTLSNAQGEMAGYVMPRIRGVTLSELYGPAGKSYTKGFTRLDYARIASGIAHAMQNLQSMGILYTDLNARNIMVPVSAGGHVDTTRVFLIDMDSTQLSTRTTGCIPGDGMTPMFAAPELLERGCHADTIRSSANVCYTLGINCLQALMCGCHPFKQNRDIDRLGERSLEEAIRMKAFPFGAGPGRRPRGGTSPANPHLFGYMERAVKQFMYDLLAGENSREENRPSFAEMVDVIDHYIAWLENADPVRYPEALSIAPTQPKPYFVRCSSVGCVHNMQHGEIRKEEAVKIGEKWYCRDCAVKIQSGLRVQQTPQEAAHVPQNVPLLESVQALCKSISSLFEGLNR